MFCNPVVSNPPATSFWHREPTQWKKVALVALALLLVAGGVAVAAQNYFFTPKLRFILGCGLQASALFPILAYSLIYFCKKQEERPLEAAAGLLCLPLEIWQHIADQSEDRLVIMNRLRRTCRLLSSLRFKPDELFYSMAKGNVTETTVQGRSIRNLFNSDYGRIGGVQAHQQKLYILEDPAPWRPYPGLFTPYSAIMVWNLEKRSFDTKDLLGFKAFVWSFCVEDDRLYLLYNDEETRYPYVKLTIWDLNNKSALTKVISDPHDKLQLHDNFVLVSGWIGNLIIYNKYTLEEMHFLHPIVSYFLEDGNFYFTAKRYEVSSAEHLGKFPFRELIESKQRQCHFYLEDFHDIPKFNYSPICNIKSHFHPFARLSEKSFFGQINDATARLTEEGEVLPFAPLYPDPCSFVCTLNDVYIVQIAMRDLVFYNMRTEECLGHISINAKVSSCVVVNDTSLAVGFENGSVRLWSPKHI